MDLSGGTMGGISVKWAAPELKDGALLKLPNGWLPPEYYDALNVLFRVENALRVFVYVVLKNAHDQSWCDLSLSSDDSNTGTITSIARQREEQDRKHGYLGRPVSSPLMYLTSGELIRLMLSEGEWRHFTNYFVAPRELIRTKLEEIGNIRNALAHFRPLTPGDVQLVKTNAMHVMVEVERALTSLLSCGQVVPTNTAEPWYAPLSSLPAAPLRLTIHQSDDEKWIALKLQFECEIVRPSVTGWHQMNPGVLALKTSSILREFPALRGHLTYLGEEFTRQIVTGPNEARFWKQISFTFGRATVQRSFADIASLLAHCCAKVEEESALLRQDELARGSLVRMVTVTGRQRKFGETTRWWCDVAPLQCPLDAGDGSEYWGLTSGAVTPDWISDTLGYPWVPGALGLIPDDDIPF